MVSGGILVLGNRCEQKLVAGSAHSLFDYDDERKREHLEGLFVSKASSPSKGGSVVAWNGGPDSISNAVLDGAAPIPLDTAISMS